VESTGTPLCNSQQHSERTGMDRSTRRITPGMDQSGGSTQHSPACSSDTIMAVAFSQYLVGIMDGNHFSVYGVDFLVGSFANIAVGISSYLHYLTKIVEGPGDSHLQQHIELDGIASTSLCKIGGVVASSVHDSGRIADQFFLVHCVVQYVLHCVDDHDMVVLVVCFTVLWCLLIGRFYISRKLLCSD
jgi:hypothetical protein